MTIRYVAVLAALAALAVLGFACRGDDDPGAGLGQRITDPAVVPTSTPIQNAVLYQVRGSEIFTQGGSTAIPSTSRTPTTRTYTVVDGDTCGGIASKLGVTTEDLMAANRTINDGCTNLRVGDVLRVPGGTSGGQTPAAPVSTSTPRPGGARDYTVKDGDTCAGIAGSFGVSVDALIARNGIDADCRSLQPGQVLQIP